MLVLNAIANAVGIALMFTVLSDNFHHTLLSVQIKFISLSFVCQFLTFANLSNCMRGSEEDPTFVYNRFSTIDYLHMS